MRVLLINPPIEDFFFTPARSYPLGLLYLAANLNEPTFKVKVLNSLETDKKTTIEIPSEFAYLKRYYHHNKSPFKLFSHYCHFGLSYPEIAAEIKLFQPDLIGISANFSCYFDCVSQVAQLAKQVDKRIRVVVGGRVATAMPQRVLSDANIDFILQGEAEFTFLNLCHNVFKGRIGDIPGLGYKTKNKIKVSSSIPIIDNLDRLSFPKREMINCLNYKFNGDVSTALITSRGCNLECRFCGINEKFRFRSASNVFLEISDCYNKGIRHFNFEDDNINFNPQWDKLVDLLIENFSGKIKISFMNGILSSPLKESLKIKLVKAGLTHLDLSLISSQSKARKTLNRKDKDKTIFSLANTMAKYNISTTVHFITAFPGQTMTGALADLKYLAKKNVLLGLSIFYPVIESRLFKELNGTFNPLSRQKNQALPFTANQILLPRGFSSRMNAQKVVFPYGKASRCASVKESRTLVRGDPTTASDNYKFFRSSVAYFDKFITRDDIFTIFYFSRIINFIKENIDIFSKPGKNVYKAIEKKTKKFKINNGLLITDCKIDRLNLGLIILRELLKDNKIYWCEAVKKETKVFYYFKEEDFILRVTVKKFLKNLLIRSLDNRSMRFRK